MVCVHVKAQAPLLILRGGGAGGVSAGGGAGGAGGAAVVVDVVISGVAILRCVFTSKHRHPSFRYSAVAVARDTRLNRPGKKT